MGGSSPALSPHGQRAERAGRGGGGNTCAGRENTCTGREGGGRGEPAGRWSLTDEEVALALPAVPKAVDKRVPDLSLGIQSGEGERSLDGGVPPCAPPPPFSPLTWMLTSSLHCLRVSRRSTSTLGTTWKRGRQDGGGFCGSTEPPGCGAALTFTAQTFSLPQSNTFRMVPKEPLATKPRI